MPIEMEPEFIVAAKGWPPAIEGRIGPGDLDYFVPQGLALSPPAIVTPYSGAAGPSFYGAGGTITHPLKSAPINDDAGGVVYFSWQTKVAEIVAALELFGFRSLETHYALFLTSAGDPREENYLDQMRIVSFAALSHFFGVDTKDLAVQSLDAGKAMQRFMEWQSSKWEGRSSDYSLEGLLGGDGDWAKERLAFGAMIENAYWGVWRIWSRAWLITK